MTILGPTTTNDPQVVPMAYLPKTTSVLAPVESAFLNDQAGNYGVAVGFGAASKATGPVFQRHVMNPGIVWADFSGKQASSWTNQYDFPASCITSANRLSSLHYGQSNATGSNQLHQLASPVPMQQSRTSTITDSAPYLSASQSYLLAPGVQNPYGSVCPYRSNAALTCAQGLPDSAALLPSCANPYQALEQSTYPASMPCVERSYGSYSACPNCTPTEQQMSSSYLCGDSDKAKWQPQA